MSATSTLPSPVSIRLSDELQEACVAGARWQQGQSPFWGSLLDLVTFGYFAPKVPPGNTAVFWGLLKTCKRFSWLDSVIRQLGSTPGAWLKDLEGSLAANATTNEAFDLSGINPPSELITTGQFIDSLFAFPTDNLSSLLQQWGVTPERYTEAKRYIANKTWQRRTLYLGRELIEVVVLMLVFLVVMREGLGEPRLIPSESMLPTLRINDRVFIEKITHWWRPYQRGDIVVFYPPSTVLKQDPASWLLRSTGLSGFLYDKESHVDVAYIKRLIGLPGDVVDIRPGQGVFINGKPLSEPYVNEVALTCTQEFPSVYCGPVKVPDGHYMLLGDNRNASQDSRYWGFLPQERVLGRAGFVMWPLSRLRWLGHNDYSEAQQDKTAAVSLQTPSAEPS